MNLSEVQDLIKFVSKSGVTEVEIEKKDFKITIKSENKKNKAAEQPIIVQAAAPVAPAPQVAPAPVAQAPAPAAPAPAAPVANEEDKYITVKSPMIGTFYRSPSPDKPVFVEVGAQIKPGDAVCIIEAMKLFNEIEAEVSGKIVKVLVDDATPVEYDQPLFLVDPS
ncbi:MAG: acetyl-CoA carboxylase biotin carboxyl carrier protein [Lishizhenia sp.]